MPLGQDSACAAVVCDDRAEQLHVVGRLLQRCGFELAGTAVDYPHLRALVREHQPVVAVVTLPLPGMDGLRAMGELREAAPDCQIVLLSAFGQLEIAAVEAGAAALVPENDLQSLQLVLRRIANPARVVDLSLADRRDQVVGSEAAAPVVPTVAWAGSSSTKPSS